MSYKIVLDAGHGENTYRETGAKGVPKMAEFEFNSAVVRYAKELAESNGFEVLLTQPLNDRDVPLIDRTNLARSEKVDLLISFHADASADPSARGHWCFFWTGHEPSGRLALMWDKNADVLLNETLDRNIRESVVGTWSEFHMCREPVKYGIPSILCEHAFMTNEEDLRLLLSDGFRRKCAEVAVRAVCEYFNVEFILLTGKENDVMRFEHDWEWKMLGDALDGLYRKGLISDYTWAEKAYNRQLTQSELTWLNTIVYARQNGIDV